MGADNEHQPWEMPGQGNAATEEERPEDFNGPARDELIDAVREAGGTAAVDVDAEESAGNEGAPPKPTPAAEGAPAADPDEPKIAAVIRAREAAQKQREEAQDFAAQRRAQAEAEAADILAKARERAAQDYESDLERRRARFRESPTAAIQELGFKPQEIVDGVVREDTPEWQAMRRMELELTAAKQQASKADQVAKDFETFRREQAQQAHQARVDQVRTEFLATHASPEKAPYLHKRWDPPEIFERANALADQWHAAGITFAHADVAEYLEHQARKRIAGDANEPPPQQVSGVAGQPAGNAPKVKANGTRTLSAANGSERRTSPKPLREMTADEERDELVRIARDERKKLGNPDV